MKILLASDGSDDAIEAAKFVNGLASGNEIQLTVLTVSYDPSNAGAATIQSWFREWSEKENQRVRQHHEMLRGLLGEAYPSLSMIQQSGPAVRHILDQAKQMEADLIVIGARGHSAIRRLLLGSVSDSIATLASCSVLVVRSPEDRTRVPHKVIVGYDTSAGSRDAVSDLMQLNWDRDTEVNVVSVVEWPYLFFDYTCSATDAMYEPEEVARVRGAAERIVSQMASKLPKTSMQVQRANHVGDAIVNIAEETDSDLVVIGDTGHSLLGELVLGSTSKYVLRHASCSVWISRHHRTVFEKNDAKAANAATN